MTTTLTVETISEETRRAATQIIAESEGAYEDELTFGGSIWIFDPESPHGPWKVYRNLFGLHPRLAEKLGMERVELLRQHAESLVNRFPQTLDHLSRVGAAHAESLISRPLRNPEDAHLWTFSIWNAALPVSLGIAFTPFHRDIQGDVIVAPVGDCQSTVVVWTEEPTEYSVGQHLGPRHPVTLAAYGRGRRKK